ncbi:H(+)-transporting two-sector ATPase [Thermobaculum terrenum ATCC BAA-798]|uniref:H(+)-transporting two-sector ATPase n=2 Tax=Thermobaculum TaxID=262406 RepID=D1CF40_THET1|nr:H(+)-transporting two-sector ATPase [Thermobaculum terrenum ATCC BAA-798]
MLPVSSNHGWTSPLVALFTSTSAVCVTGLVVVDTGTYWSPFGQLVILLLMEVGGLGFVVGATALVLLGKGRLGFQEREIVRQTGTTLILGGQSSFVTRAVTLALVGQLAGAILLLIRFIPEFGLIRGIWMSIFHSVAAFTNGSFDLFGDYRSLAGYRSDPLVLLTIAMLIIAGGTSLLVAEDLWRHRSWRKFTLDTKIIVIGIPTLLILGTVFIMLIESKNPNTLGNRPLGEQLLNSFFHSSAARTAGFTTWNFGLSDDRTLFFVIGLMFIGSAPGSMAGGIKITTMAIILAVAWSNILGRRDTELMRRRVPQEQVGQALTVALLGVLLIVTIALTISLLERARFRDDFIKVLFEVTSAFGTVGLSTGITPELSAPSQILLIITMFVGRLGPVTLATSLSHRSQSKYRFPIESVRIG